MAATQYTTMLTDLIDPEVIADEIDKKLVDYIRFSPLATIDNTLVGRPGDTLTFPSYTYIGDAVSVNEGADIPIAKLTASGTPVKVGKYGKAVQFTDEALLSGNANSVANEASKQVLIALASGVEGALITNVAANASLSYTAGVSEDAAEVIASALIEFGEDIDGEKVLVCSPSFYGKLLKSKAWIPNTEIGANIIIRGSVGMVHGCQVVVANRLTVTSGTEYAYIIKPGALRIVMKRDTLVEFDRDKLDQTNYIIGSKLFAPYLYDASKVIKVAIQTIVST